MARYTQAQRRGPATPARPRPAGTASTPGGRCRFSFGAYLLAQLDPPIGVLCHRILMHFGSEYVSTEPAHTQILFKALPGVSQKWNSELVEKRTTGGEGKPIAGTGPQDIGL